jgi:hypothetical protein
VLFFDRSHLRTHDCGGTILAGPGYRYCDRCAAFTYFNNMPIPGGTDRDANRAAFDAGEDESPDAEATAFICTNDAYCPSPDTFASVNVFRAMCHAAFGTAPVLTPRNGGSVFVDESGAVVLRRVSA